MRIAAAVDLLSNGLSARYYRQVILRFVVSYMAFTICNFEYAVEYKYKIHSDWYKLALFCEWSIIDADTFDAFTYFNVYKVSMTKGKI